MPSIRIGFASDFTLKSKLVGIGTTTADSTLEVAGILKGDFNVTGVSTLAVYGGFAAQKQNVTLSSNIGFSTTGIGTFVQVDESETGFTSLVGEYNTVSDDIIVDDGKIFQVSTGSTVSVGTLESVSIQSHFNVPNGGSNDRPDQPTEGMVRFNDDLNTLEFYNGIEWRQFTVSGASGRGVFGGGADPSYKSTIDYITIATTGNAVNFGELSAPRAYLYSCSSNIRGLWGGGYIPSVTNTIEYGTLASSGKTQTFGNLTSSKSDGAASSSSTRGLFGAGYAPGFINTIDYIQIATIGNALDFGDLTVARAAVTSFSSPIRGVWGGGETSPGATKRNEIDFITISSKGNAVDFGQLTTTRGRLCGCSSPTRGLFAAGELVPGTTTNIIDYITITSTGNATDFGDLTYTSRSTGGNGACSSNIRGVFTGGINARNNLDYVTIPTTGNAQDFGDLSVGRFILGGCSDSHGGLGGF